MQRRRPPRRRPASDRPGPRRLAQPIRRFLETEASGGIVLLGATIVALALANLPWRAGYEDFWLTDLSFRIGSFEVGEDLRGWVNDGLMAIFFFVVGLEIKRELVVGELSSRRNAALPVVAAVGGMVVPAALYALFNAGGEGSAGWGIPMATDIAFAVGVLALLGRRAPSGLKVFLLSLAIVDDIGAILVIALFYSGGISLAWLAAAVAGLMVVVLLRGLRVPWTPVYVVIGAAVWLATLESGVHATIAGVALGFLAPARPLDPEGAVDAVRQAEELVTDPSASRLHDTMVQTQEVVSVAERLEHLLHPWTSFAVIPVFALANAGIPIGSGVLADAVDSPVAIGIAVGLVVGKLVGVAGASWLAVKAGLGALPADVTWRHMLGAAALAGIGFTVSLFIAGLAFDDAALIGTAKTGIFIGSLGATAVGGVLLATAKR